MGTTDQIDNYPGFPQGVNGFELAMQMQQGAERFGARTELTEVISVELAGPVKQVRTQSGTYQGRTVVLATGASPRELGLPGEGELRGRGVSYCATCDGMFYRGRTVAVVGGGNTAVATCCISPVFARRSTSSTGGIRCGPPKSTWTPCKRRGTWSFCGTAR